MRSFQQPLILGLYLVLACLPARGQNYFGFSYGNARTYRSDLRLIQPATGTNVTFRNVSWRLASHLSAPYFSLRYGGYFPRYRHWGLEFNYTHNKAVLNAQESVPVSGTLNGQAVNAVRPISDTIQRLEILNGENIFALNLLYRSTGRETPSFPQGRTQFYVGMGPAFYWLHNSNRVNNQNSASSYQASGIGFESLLGVSYGLTRRFSLFLEGKYTDVSARLGTANNGIIETPLRSWHISLGVTYRL